MTITLAPADWLQLLLHYLALSLLSIGGAISAAPDMHRFLVDRQQWLTDPQFSASIAIAQAAPGPNVLFIALLGWNVGLNAGGVATAFLGMTLCMTGALAPSTILTFLATRWGRRNRDLPAVRAFKQGLAPVVIALLIATGWILASGTHGARGPWPVWGVAIASALVVWRTRLHLLWVLAAGGAVGWQGWI